MATLSKQIEALIRKGTTTTRELVQAIPGAGSSSVPAALSKMVAAGRLQRLATGQYVLVDQTSPPAPSSSSLEPTVAEDSETSLTSAPPAGDVATETQSPLRWSLWDDGELVFFIDNQPVLTVGATDVERLAVWLSQRVA